MTYAPALVLEDAAMFNDALTFCLERSAGLQPVKQCSTLQQAIAVFKTLRPQIVVFDWFLPDGCGLDLLTTFAGEHPETGWICLTSSTDPAVIARAIDAGVDGLVIKDTALRVLVDAIAAVRRQETFYCETVSRLMVKHILHASAPISPRAREVEEYFVAGSTVKQIAEKMSVSEKTVYNHLEHLRRHYAVSNNAALLRSVIERKGISYGRAV